MRTIQHNSLGWRHLRTIYWRTRSSAQQIYRLLQHRRARFSALVNGCRLVLPASAVVTVPLRCEGVGSVTFGSDCHLGYHRSFRCGTGEILVSTRSKHARVSVGHGTWINNNCSIASRESVEIGPRCLIGFFVMICDFEAHALEPSLRHNYEGEAREIILGENVWIGDRVTILKGASVGDNSVIGACSVVTGSIPRNVVAAGCPARVIREINSEAPNENTPRMKCLI